MMKYKKLGLLTIVIAVLMISTSVAYAYTYAPVPSTTITTNEPLTITIVNDLSIAYPGETDRVTLQIVNAASVTYGVTIAVGLGGPATYAYAGVTGALTQASGWTFDLASGTGKLFIDVTADSDAAPSGILVSFTVERL